MTLRLAAVLATAALVTGITGWVPAHGQTEASSFEATAASEGIRISVAAPNFVLVDTLADVGIPVAQSLVDGLGNSKAFASNPYPGDLVISGPGLFAGLTGLPNPGNYPLFVQSTYPTAKEAKFSQPSFELSAKSDEQASQALAAAGGASGASSVGAVKATANSKRDAGTGAVIAEAISNADIVNGAGVLRIGSIMATAKVTRQPNGKPVRQSSLKVDGVTVAGQGVGFTDKGLVIAGTATPLPENNPLAQILTQAHINVKYLAAITDADGIVSPGLVIEQQQQVPNGPNVIVSYVFGRATAHATAAGGSTSASSGQSAGGGEQTGTGTTGTGGETAAPSASGTSGGQLSSGDTSAATGGATTGSASTGSGASAAPSTDTGTLPSTGRALSGRQAGSGPSTASLYVILIIGGVVALGGVQALRILGVRMAWTS